MPVNHLNPQTFLVKPITGGFEIITIYLASVKVVSHLVGRNPGTTTAQMSVKYLVALFAKILNQVSIKLNRFLACVNLVAGPVVKTEQLRRVVKRCPGNLYLRKVLPWLHFVPYDNAPRRWERK